MFASTFSIVVDGNGNASIVDTDNNTLRVLTPAGFVGTLLGDPGRGVNRPGSLRDDSDLPLADNFGALHQPRTASVSPEGNVLFITTGNGVMEVSITG